MDSKLTTHSVWLGICSTGSYDVHGIGTSEQETRELVSERVYQMLSSAGRLPTAVQTAADVADYYGLHITAMQIGTTIIK